MRLVKQRNNFFVAVAFLAGICMIAADYDHDDSDHDDDDDGQPNYCPEGNGMFRNPTDCTTFFNCVDGQAIPMSCAPGLLFDPKKKMCNFPNQVKCYNQCRGPNGLFPSQHRCDEFVLCTNNKPKVQRCKKGLYFDANLQVCNYKGQVICNLPGGGSKGNKTEGNRYRKNKSYNRNDDDDENTDTDGRVRVGDYADDSERRSSAQAALAKMAADSVRSVCPERRGLFAHAQSCDRFYQCWDGEVVVKSCPEGLLFDVERRTCAYNKEVRCGGRELPLYLQL